MICYFQVRKSNHTAKELTETGDNTAAETLLKETLTLAQAVAGPITCSSCQATILNDTCPACGGSAL